MAKLYITSLGSSARNFFCEQLTKLEYGHGAIVLPNRLLLEEVQARYNVECIGMDTLAVKVLNLNGYEDFHQINRRSQELVIQNMLNDLLAAYKLPYFGKLALKPGFIKAMASLVGQLSRSGSTQEQIVNILSAWDREGDLRQKDKEIALLYNFYRNYLKNKDWFDLEGKYRLAIWILENAKVKLPWQRLYFSDFYSFDALQLDFLQALSERCHITVGMCYEKNLQGQEREKIFAASADSYMALENLCLDEKIESYTQDFIAEPACVQVIKNLGRACQPVSTDDAVRLYSFQDRDKEIRWALTNIKQLLQQGIASQKILLAVRDLSTYSGLRLVADEYGVPVDLPQTGNLAVQPLTEMVLLLLQAVCDNHKGAQAYFELVSAPLLHLLLTVDGEAVNSLQENAYFTSRSGVQVAVQEKLAVEDEILNLIDDLLEKIPRQAKVTEYGALLLEFLCSLKLAQRLGSLYQQNKVQLAAVTAALQTQKNLMEVIQQLMDDYVSCGMGEVKISLPEWQELLRNAAAEVEIVLCPGRKDGVLVTEAGNAQGLAFDYVFLLGLREGEFPRANNENWIYNDRERKELKALGLDLPNTSLSYAEDAYFFASVAAAARKQLVLSYFEDDQARAGAYINAVQKLFAPQTLEAISEPEKICASAGEFAQKAASEEWLRQQWGAPLLDAAQADKLRLEDERYNGVLLAENLQAHVRQKIGSTFSASGLEIYAACPFKYLGQRVWQQQEFVAKDEQPTPADEGDLLHQVLARFTSRYLQKKISAMPLAALQKELAEIFAAVAQEAEAQGKIVNNVFWQAEAQQLHQLLQLWLQFEYDDQKNWTGFMPWAVEWDFGSKNKRALRLQLSDGTQIALTGRIDRIDSDGHRFFVTDYKRSGSSVPSGKDLANGFDVQLPLYLLALADLHSDNNSVVGGTYFVLKDGQRKSSFLLENAGNPNLVYKKAAQGINDSWDSFQSFAQKLITDYIEAIYAGNFAVAPRKKCSAYCPLRNICRLSQMPQAEGGVQADE